MIREVQDQFNEMFENTELCLTEDKECSVVAANIRAKGIFVKATARGQSKELNTKKALLKAIRLLSFKLERSLITNETVR